MVEIENPIGLTCNNPNIVIIFKTKGKTLSFLLYKSSRSPTFHPRFIQLFSVLPNRHQTEAPQNIFPSLSRENVCVQQNPPHCEAPPDAAAVAQEGLGCLLSCSLRRALRTRGDLCGDQLQAIRGARVVPEPPHLQEALGPGRGRVRLLQHRPISHSLRRVRF